MSTKGALHEAPKPKRPSIFWWTLAHLLVIAFAVTTWTTCLYVFNYPEKPGNYDLLRRIGRLTPVTAFDPLEAPEGTPASPEALYKKFFPQKDAALAGLNLQFRRGYIRNYEKTDPRFTLYAEGEFVVESIRLLESTDFFSPGLRVLARARVRPDELSEPGPYPVWLDLLLPTSASPSPGLLAPGDLLSLEHINHRVSLLHATRTNRDGETGVLVTAAPLSYDNFKDRDGKPLPLTAPEILNLTTSFGEATE